MTPYIFENLEFFVLLVPALAIILAAKRAGIVAFKVAVIAASTFFVAALPLIKWVYLALIGCILIAVYVTALVLLHFRQDKRRIRMIFLIAGSVVVFSLVKFESVSSLLSRAIGLEGDYRASLLPLLGFAFLAVKCYSLLADIAAGKIKELGVLDFLAYFVFFPTFLAGPIERFSAFSTSLQTAVAARSELEVLETQLARFLIGAFKVFVIAGVFQPHALPFLKEGDFERGSALYVGAVAYYAFEYMNFSGYSDMAISTSRLIGIPLPENFNFPFMARSLTELWRRWHMTFAAWLRDYIYYPLLFVLMQRFRPKGGAQVNLSALAVFVTFFICGLWHGDHLGMILFGTLSGLILGAETIVAARYGPRVARVLKERPGLGSVYDWVARLVTLHLALLTFGPVLLTNQQLGLVGKYFSNDASLLVTHGAGLLRSFRSW